MKDKPDPKPTLTIVDGVPTITIPLVHLTKGMRTEAHRIGWRAHGIEVDVSVTAKLIEEK